MKKILIALVVIVLLAVAGVYLFGSNLLNGAIKAGVEEVGPQATGTSVTVQSVNISPFSGKGEIKGFVVGNPEGFKTPTSFELQDFQIVVDTDSISSDVIVIKEIKISQAKVTCELALKNNLKTILANIEAFAGSSESQAGESQTKVAIEHFLFTDGSAVLRMGGQEKTLPVKRFELRDIGKKTTPVTIAEALPQMIKPIIDSILKQAATGGLTEGVDVEGVKTKATDAVKEGMGKVKGLFGK